MKDFKCPYGQHRISVVLADGIDRGLELSDLLSSHCLELHPNNTYRTGTIHVVGYRADLERFAALDCVIEAVYIGSAIPTGPWQPRGSGERD